MVGCLFFHYVVLINIFRFSVERERLLFRLFLHGWTMSCTTTLYLLCSIQIVLCSLLLIIIPQISVKWEYIYSVALNSIQFIKISSILIGYWVKITAYIILLS